MEAGADAVDTGEPPPEAAGDRSDEAVGPENEPPSPELPVKVPLPELPVKAGLLVTEDGDAPDAEPEPVLPLLPATKAGDAVELTCTVARSKVTCCSFGIATGSWEVSEGGRREANWLAAASRVLRSITILRPSRVRLAEAPLTVSVALVSDMVMPSSLSTVLMEEIGSDSGALCPAAFIPLASTATCSPAMTTFCTRVDPVTFPVVPSEVAVAVDVILPIVMSPSRRETPPMVALALEVAFGPGVPEEEVADIEPTPMRADEPASGLPVPDGAVWVGSAPSEPAVEDPSPSVALAVFPLAVLAVSMLTPGASVEPVLGACGYSLVAWIGQTGAGGSGKPGTSSASWGPALAITWPG